MSDNLRSILIGAALAAGGAALAVLSDAAAGGSFGAFSAVVGAVASVALNVLRKYGTPPVAPPPALVAAAAALVVVAFLAGSSQAQDCPNGRCPRVQAVLSGVQVAPSPAVVQPAVWHQPVSPTISVVPAVPVSHPRSVVSVSLPQRRWFLARLLRCR